MSDDRAYLLDTSIIIRLLRRRPVEALVNRVGPLIAARRAAFNDVVRAELLIGCKIEAEMRTVRTWLAGLVDFKVNTGTWAAAAELGFRLRRNGITAALPDLLIAASAMEHDTLVMHVNGDFDRIAEHSDLRVESYVEALN